MEWISANIANIIVLLVVAVVILLALRGLVRAKQAGCKTECIGCSVAHICSRNPKNGKNPLVEAYHQAYPKK